MEFLLFCVSPGISGVVLGLGVSGSFWSWGLSVPVVAEAVFLRAWEIRFRV